MEALMLTSYIGRPPSLSCFLPVWTSFKTPHWHIIYSTLAKPNRVSLIVRFKSKRTLQCLHRICLASSCRSTILRPSFQPCDCPMVKSMAPCFVFAFTAAPVTVLVLRSSLSRKHWATSTTTTSTTTSTSSTIVLCRIWNTSCHFHSLKWLYVNGQQFRLPIHKQTNIYTTRGCYWNRTILKILNAKL